MGGTKFTLPGFGGFIPQAKPTPPPPPPPPPVIIDKKQKQVEEEGIQLEAKRKAQRDRAAGTRTSSVIGDVGSEDKLGA